MKQRFDAFLEQKFKDVKSDARQVYTEQYSEYLLGKEAEYRAKGMTDDNVIFDMAVRSMEGFEQDVAKAERLRAGFFTALGITGKGLLIALTYVLGVTFLYLLLSFTCLPWNVSWLVMVGGVLLGIVAASLLGVVYFTEKNMPVVVRLLNVLWITLLVTFTFLLCIKLTEAKNVWLLFVALPIGITGADTAVAFASKSVTRFFSLTVFTECLFALGYVILGLCKVVPWHPYWFLPVLGGVIDVLIGVLATRGYYKRLSVEEEEDNNE